VLGKGRFKYFCLAHKKGRWIGREREEELKNKSLIEYIGIKL